MLFWSILLGVSIIGVFALPLFRMFRPDNKSSKDSLLRDHLQKHLGSATDVVLKTTLTSGWHAGKGLSFIYSKGLSVIKNTKLHALVKGRGILKRKDISSDFLKNVKEHKDKIRENLLKNGDEGKVLEDKN